MIINCCQKNQTTKFAASELERYLLLLDKNIPESFEITLIQEGDDELDKIDIEIGKNGGTIKGSNPRSVLFGVYEYLKALGIKWVRHGSDGEYIPENVTVSGKEVNLKHTATSKHRGTCLEGASSRENLIDNVDWCAKMGMNIFFTQYTSPYGFINRWYSHQFNPLFKDEHLTLEKALKIKADVVAEIKKRGMLFHDVGHGWTSGALGGSELDTRTEFPEEIVNCVAMINGKRSTEHGISNVNLCYSNPVARKKMVDFCVDFIEKHPEIDVLHYWLADAVNEQCECEECVKKRTSDWYMLILNEIDSILTAKNIKTKIVFLAYLDTLWAPQTEKLNNPDRFIFMLAPIGRQYRESYLNHGVLPEEPPYVLNKLTNPVDVESNIMHFKNWQSKIPLDSFSYEYYYWRGGNEHYGDYGGIKLAKIVYEDIKAFEEIGLNGIVSCQTQRAFMPTGFGQHVMARMLWDRNQTFEQLLKEYFVDAFGENLADKFIEYLEKQSENGVMKKGVEKTERTQKAAEEMLGYLNSLEEPEALCHKKSVFYVKFHCELLVRFMKAEKKNFDDGEAAALPLWHEFFTYIREREPEVQPVFDLCLFLKDLRSGYSKHRELAKYPELWAAVDNNIEIFDPNA